MTLPEGLSINPDAADGQTACTDARGQLRQRGPGQLPGQLEDRQLRHRHAGADRPADRLALLRRAAARATSTGSSWSPAASGSTPSSSPRCSPDPETGQADRRRRRPAAGPVRRVQPAPLRLRPRPDRDADPLHDLPGRLDLRPLERHARLPALAARSSASTRARTAAPARAQVRPFHPRLVAGTSNPVAGAFSAFTPEARPRRRRPVPRRPQLHDAAGPHRRPARDRLLPGGRDQQAAAQTRAAPSRRSRAAAPRARSAPPTSPPGPGSHPFHAVGKMYLAGPFKGAPLSLVAITPALAGPYDYGTVVVRVALHVDPLDAQVSADLRHRALDHRRRPDPDALDPGQHRQAQLHDQPDQLLRLTSIDSQGIGDQGTVTDFSLLLPRGQLRGAALQAEDDGQPGRRPQGTSRSANPQLQFDLRTRPGDANIKSLVGHPPERLRDRPAPPRQHLLGEGAGRQSSAPAARRSASATTTRRCSTSRSPAPSTRSRAPAACRASPSSSTARSTWCRGPKPRPFDQGRRRRLQTTVPVVPDAPIGHFPLTVFGGKTRLPGQHPRPLRESASGDEGRLHRAEREDLLAGDQGQVVLRRQAPEEGARQAPRPLAPPTLLHDPASAGRCPAERRAWRDCGPDLRLGQGRVLRRY